MDYNSIRELTKSRRRWISPVFLNLKLYADTIVVNLHDVSINYKSKCNGTFLSSEGEEYRYHYDVDKAMWIMLPLKHHR